MGSYGGFGSTQGALATKISSAAFPLLAPNGTAGAPSYSFSGNTNSGMYNTSGVVGFSSGGGYKFDVNSIGVGVGSASIIGFHGDDTVSGTIDVMLARDAAAVLALKNGTTAQEFRVYGTTTGSKYLSVKHNGTNGILDISSGTFLIGQGTTPIVVANSGASLGFYGTSPIALQTGVAVTAGGIHAALVALGLITA